MWTHSCAMRSPVSMGHPLPQNPAEKLKKFKTFFLPRHKSISPLSRTDSPLLHPSPAGPQRSSTMKRVQAKYHHPSTESLPHFLPLSFHSLRRRKAPASKSVQKSGGSFLSYDDDEPGIKMYILFPFFFFPFFPLFSSSLLITYTCILTAVPLLSL